MASRTDLVRLADIARRAGATALDHRARGVDIRHKADASPVTGADDEAQAVILEALTAWDPSIPVVAEESAIPSAPERAAWSRFWLVDPIDGTKEFIRGSDEFTVNVALVEDGEPVLGVVHAPAMGLLYVAGRGQGAWRCLDGAGWERLVSRRPHPMQAVRVATSRSHTTPELETFLETLPVASRLRAGSSVKFCWLADGRVDLYARTGTTMEWDVAAGDCVFRCSAPEGEWHSPLRYNKPTLENGPFVVGFVPTPVAAVAVAFEERERSREVIAALARALDDRNVAWTLAPDGADVRLSSAAAAQAVDWHQRGLIVVVDADRAPVLETAVTSVYGKVVTVEAASRARHVEVRGERMTAAADARALDVASQVMGLLDRWRADALHADGPSS